MADRATDAWQGALDANARYYEAWGRLAGDYVRELTEVLRGVAPKVTLPDITLPGVTVPSATAATSGSRPPASSAPASPPATAVVLEAPVGATATGAVLVQNHLSHPVSAEVVASFPGDDGVDVEVDPRRVDLAPGEAAVVRVTATVPAPGPAGEVRGELLVPELVGTAVPLVVRERTSGGEPSGRG